MFCTYLSLSTSPNPWYIALSSSTSNVLPARVLSSIAVASTQRNSTGTLASAARCRAVSTARLILSACRCRKTREGNQCKAQPWATSSIQAASTGTSCNRQMDDGCCSKVSACIAVDEMGPASCMHAHRGKAIILYKTAIKC